LAAEWPFEAAKWQSQVEKQLTFAYRMFAEVKTTCRSQAAAETILPKEVAPNQPVFRLILMHLSPHSAPDGPRHPNALSCSKRKMELARLNAQNGNKDSVAKRPARSFSR
jgi:hypothetical protein